MPIRNDMCFACGCENTIGLRLQFQDGEWTARTEFIATPAYQGYPGILHGGITSTILDEVMVRPLVMKEISAATAKMEVRFRNAVPIGAKLIARSELVAQRGKSYEMKGYLTLEDGTPLAEANAIFMRF